MTGADRKLRALVVDDEPLARKRLLALLADEPDVEVAGQAGSGREAVSQIASLRPDLVLLDVQMPGLDGFEVLRAVDAEHLPAVIFVTAHDTHAIRAFEVQAMDYLLKPVVEERFRAAMRRAVQGLRGTPAAQISQQLADALDRLRPAAAAQRLPVRTADRITFVRVADIDWIDALGDYARLHVGKQTHLLRETLSALERRLSPAAFLRVHRSIIVQVDRIDSVQPWRKGDYLLILRDGTQLASGRTYRDRLQRLLA